MDEEAQNGDPPEGPNPIDVHVGARIHLRRRLVGMSQAELSDALGISFQQVQKYERGVNRVSASRLYDLSRVLDVAVSYFFQGFEEASRPRTEAAPSSEPVPGSIAIRRETLEFVRAYGQISDPRMKRQLFELAKALAEPAGGAPPLLEGFANIQFLSRERRDE